MDENRELTVSSPSTAAPVPTEKLSWMFYVGMFLAASLSPLGSTMIAVALPSIGQELDVGGGSLTQWLVSSYLIVGIAFMSPGGKLGDRIGHEKGLVLGMAIYGGGSLIGFALANLASLAFARMCMALGGALAVPAAMALLRNLVPAERRARTFGYFGSVMGTAAALGPLVGGELTAQFGWRSVFIANLPVILIAFVLIRFARPRTRIGPMEEAKTRPRFDVLGSVFLGLSLTLLVVAPQLGSPFGATIGLAGALVLGVFAFWEQRVAEPVLDLGMFRKRSFAAAGAVIGLQNLAMYALLFQLPIFFEQVRGAEAGTTGRSIIAMMIAMVVFSPIGGRLAERIGVRLTTFSGSMLTLVGINLVVDFNQLAVPADVLPGLVMLGAGLGLSMAPSQAAAMSAVSRDDAGMAAGAVSTARYIGGVVGISTLGYVLARAGEAGSTEAHMSAGVVYVTALVAATMCALVLPDDYTNSRVNIPNRNSRRSSGAFSRVTASSGQRGTPVHNPARCVGDAGHGGVVDATGVARIAGPKSDRGAA